MCVKGISRQLTGAGCMMTGSEPMDSRASMNHVTPSRKFDPFSLTRTIYVVSVAVLFYEIVAFFISRWSLRTQAFSWGTSHFSPFELAFYGLHLVFIFITVIAAMTYTPRSELLHWPQSTAFNAIVVLRAIGIGLIGGICAFGVATPFLWFGARRVDFIRSLIAQALSPKGVLVLVFFVVALALGSELLYRGVLFRTLATYVSLPAAILGSCMVFAFTNPLFGLPEGIIIGAACAVVYYRTRHLLTAITANAVFMVSAGGLTLYHSLMR